MEVFIYTHVFCVLYIYMSFFSYIYMHMYIHGHMHTHMYICTWISVCVCIWGLCIHVCKHVFFVCMSSILWYMNVYKCIQCTDMCDQHFKEYDLNIGRLCVQWYFDYCIAILARSRSSHCPGRHHVPEKWNPGKCEIQETVKYRKMWNQWKCDLQENETSRKKWFPCIRL